MQRYTAAVSRINEYITVTWSKSIIFVTSLPWFRVFLAFALSSAAARPFIVWPILTVLPIVIFDRLSAPVLSGVVEIRSFLVISVVSARAVVGVPLIVLSSVVVTSACMLLLFAPLGAASLITFMILVAAIPLSGGVSIRSVIS